jgi:hypothetical protein
MTEVSFSNTDRGSLVVVVDAAVVVDATVAMVVVVVGTVESVTSDVDVTSDVVGGDDDDISPTGVSEEQAVMATITTASRTNR